MQSDEPHYDEVDPGGEAPFNNTASSKNNPFKDRN